MATAPRRTTFHVNDDPAYNQTIYYAKRPLSVLGCADQYQICTQAHTECTPLTGLDALLNATTVVQWNKVQNDTVLGLYDGIACQATYFNVDYRGLRASEMLDSGQFHPGLPDNQWTIEIQNWFAISMAKLQQLVVDFATGPLYANNDLVVTPGPPNACGRQKVRNRAGYISFSTLGVLIILGVGGALIFTSLILDSVVGYFRKTYDWKDFKRLHWDRDEQLELQRLAYSKEDVLLQGNESSEGNAVSQTSEEDAVSQANEENALPSEGNAVSQTSEEHAVSQVSEENALTSHENAVPQPSGENLVLRTENAVSQTRTPNQSGTTTPEQTQPW